MTLQIDKEWLLRMAEKEANGIVSVGGLVCGVEKDADAQASPAPEQSASDAVNSIPPIAPPSEEPTPVGLPGR
jgi:hypothetical protein